MKREDLEFPELTVSGIVFEISLYLILFVCILFVVVYNL
jgi:hypothetical protein